MQDKALTKRVIEKPKISRISIEELFPYQGRMSRDRIVKDYIYLPDARLIA